jgi:hypothetical protein
MTTKENSSITAFKTWIFPSLVSILGMLIWQDVNEIKSDVKALMAQSNIDKTRIDNLERVVYASKPTTLNISTPVPPNKLPSQIFYHEMVAIKPNHDEEDNRNNKLLDDI